MPLTTIVEPLEPRRLLTADADAMLIGPRDADFAGGNVVANAYRQGKHFTLAKAVAAGAYTLKLHFAEPHFQHAGKRQFDVYAEGAKVLDGFDIAAASGRRAELVKSFMIEVDDGQLDLAFVSVRQHAIVSRIELVPRPAPPPSIPPAPLYVNAGGESLRDSIARTFRGDVGFTGGAMFHSAGDVLNTDDDALFSTFRAGAHFTFAHPVADGNYTLWLEFADLLSTSAGERTFDVFAEGAQVLEDFDIVASAGGAQTAFARRFDLHIADGKLDLSFHGVAGEAMINAIVLIPTDIPPEALPYTGVSDFSDPLLHAAAVDLWTTRSQMKLRNIGLAVFLYANDHRGRFPPDFHTLADGWYASHDTFASPLLPTYVPRGELSRLEETAWVTAQDDYLYFGAGLNHRTSTEETVLAVENPLRTPGATLNVLFGDGRVDGRSREQVHALIGGSSISPAPAERPMDIVGDATIIASATRLHPIAAALYHYANTHRGIFPPDLGELFKWSKLPAETFFNPRGSAPLPPPGLNIDETADWINTHSDYGYAVASKRYSQIGPVFVYEFPGEMPGGINILLSDGRVEFRETRWALETLARAGVV